MAANMEMQTVTATFNRKDLTRLLATMSTVVPKRSPLPITECLHVELAGSRATFTATDLDTAISQTIANPYGWEFATIAVPFKPLQDAVKALAGDEVTWSIDEDLLHVSSGGRVIAVRLPYPATDYPHISTDTNEPHFTIRASSLLDLFASTLPFAAQDETRPVLTVVKLDMTGDEIRAQSADGFTAATATFPLHSFDIRSALIPASAVKTAIKAFAKAEYLSVSYIAHTVTVTNATTGETREQDAGISHIQFRSQDGTVLRSRVIDGQYPNLEAVKPSTVASEYTVDTAVLMDAIRFVATGCKHGRLVALKPSMQNSLAVTGKEELDKPSHDRYGHRHPTTTHELPETSTTVTIDGLTFNAYANEHLEVAFNSRYLLAALAAVQADTAVLRLSGKQSCATLAAHNREILLMPMHTR